jgi:hypothetical protein
MRPLARTNSASPSAPQSRQPLAGRRLGQPQRIGRKADAAQAIHRFEQAKQVHVQFFTMHAAYFLLDISLY